MKERVRDTLVRRLSEIEHDLRDYRTAVNRIFSRRLTMPRDCRKYFLSVFTSALKLYLDSLMMKELEASLSTSELESADKPDLGLRAAPPRERHIMREHRMRQRFKDRLESLAGWSQFDPTNAFADENQLRTRADYVRALGLHVPEIYEEALLLERRVRCLHDKEHPFNITDFIVRLEHVAHHVSYCHYALEILSQEYHWM